MRIAQIVTVALLTLCMVSTASAERRAGLGGKYTARNMTAAQGSLTILAGPTSTQTFGIPASGFGGSDAGINYTTKGADSVNFIDFNFGAAYGITPELEAGVFIPLALSSPDGFDRDTLGNPMIFATYAKDMGNFDVGGRIAFIAPVQEGADPGALLGVPLLFRLGNSRVDTGVFVPLSFGDETGKALNIPVRFTQSVTPKIYLGAETGLILPDIKTDNGAVPLSIFGGYTLLAGGNVIDLGASVGFPSFFSLAEGAENPITDIMQISVGANAQVAF